ncbi:tetratricopeptide repeat-containing sulfotransferase family protein [Sulfitobacter guttiformis]|uniref:Tfp pilus assembly protein PilF n=1 Tax=Sulfitobacter guttiformis TaxID=74349 RepID=A0A420DTK3_9RHOB|nr:tetratricopeptide repeat-containing sulfotransferase family protein [Sulfitobacter guttiformis]KIN74915.1 putative tpr domain protein [Sulfitobacter guttiformis KCTC 32187]RKE97479.1 Tfp pilus assembly protein PilF [Sulfitobacter guttiformis]
MSVDTPLADTRTPEAVNADLERIKRHQNAGRFPEAQAMITKLIATQGEVARLVHLRGLNVAMQGDVDAGLAELKSAMSLDVKDVSIIVDYGALLAQKGRIDEAVDVFQAGVDTAPKHALAHANLGAALVVNKDYPRAIAALKTAIELDDTLNDSRLNLAQAYIRMGAFQPAVDVLFRALAQDPQSAGAHVNLALALFRRERHDAAEHHARRALELVPDAPEAWLHLGAILGAAGRMDEAVEALLRAAESRDFGLAATSRIVSLRKTTSDSPELALLEGFGAKLAAKPDAPAETRSTYHFARGKAAQDLADYDMAAHHFALGNAATAEVHPFDRAKAHDQNGRVRELVTPALMSRLKAAGLRSNAPVFICGLPRSGTTLMEQMFSRHPDVQAGGEMIATQVAFSKNPVLRAILEKERPADDLSEDNITQFAEDYVEFLHREGLKSDVVTDKMPANYYYIGVLAMAFPRARFVLMRRHPLDCLLSNYTQNFGRNQTFSSSFENLGLVYNLFDSLATHWQKLLPEQVRVVQYEDVVADAEAQMRSLLEFTGLPWNDDVLDHIASSRGVNTASVAQVREPIYTRSVKRWQRYGPHIQGLALAVRDHLTAEELRACGVTQA